MVIEHGGNVAVLAERLGYPLGDCLDFSANINPLGLSTSLKTGLVASLDKLVHYPDPDYRRARQLLADHHEQALEQVLLANGAVEIFYDLARVLRPRRVLTLSPTFMEYEKAFSQQGAKMCYHVLEAPSYTWEFAGLLPSLLELEEGDVVIICNPNNPTGSLVEQKELYHLASYLLERKIGLIIDEAFLDFIVDEKNYSFIPYLKSFPNVLVVRSLTKFYAIPGLRLGYALSHHPRAFSMVREMRPPWTVNSLAVEALPLLLGDKAYQAATRSWLVRERECLYQGLLTFPQLQVVQPSANYIFFRYLGKGDLREKLWQDKIFIRSCRNYHQLTKQHYRIAIREREENQRLLQALEGIFKREEGAGRD